ncbi:MAG: hypothetical protein WCK67_06840 [bacterium]
MTTGNTNIIANASTALSKVYAGKLSSGLENINTDPVKGTTQLALGVNNLPFTFKTMGQSSEIAKDAVGSVQNYYQAANGSPVESLKMIKDSKPLFNPKVLDATNYQKLDSFHFFFEDTFLGKAVRNPELAEKMPLLGKLGNAALAMDKNLYDVCGDQVVKKLGGSLVKEEVNGVLKTVAVENSALGAFAGNSLAKIPLIGVAISAALEVPSIIKGFQKNDGWEQVGRSTMNVAAGSVGAAIGGTLLAPVIPPIGTLVGCALGGWLGSKVAGFMGENLIGKPKGEEEEQQQPLSKEESIAQNMIEQQKQQLLEREQRTLNA